MDVQGTDDSNNRAPSSAVLEGLSDFQHAATLTLAYLAERLPFGLWMVTRTEGEDWIVLNAADRGYSVVEGQTFRWSDSFCSRMVDGLGPRVAPRAMDVAAYREAPIGRQVPIEAYVGVPILSANETLFGTLCAIDPSPQPAEIVNEQPLIELLAALLGTILAADQRADLERRNAERAHADAMTDALTGIANRRAWQHVLDAEEARCKRYGDPASVVVIDLDGLKTVNDHDGHAAGDELIRAAANTIRSTVRESDFAARTGGDEFAALIVHAGRTAADAFVERLAEAIADVGIAASIGTASRDPISGLDAAWREADANMYTAKRQRAAGRATTRLSKLHA